ncbi:MAG: energy transducer TonB [Actinotalea sp.]|nr:energy transducer TonB [Actinotalea sp.]
MSALTAHAATPATQGAARARRLPGTPAGQPAAIRRRRPRLLLLPPVDPPARPAEEAVPPGPPPSWSVRSPLTEAAWAPRPVPTPEPEPAPLPDPGDLARAVVVCAVEALAGARPLAQLVRWLTPELYEHLAGTRAARGAVTGPVRRATARSATVCRVAEEVAEATVVVHDGLRVRAAAVRLEVHRRRWRAAVLEIY